MNPEVIIHEVLQTANSSRFKTGGQTPGLWNLLAGCWGFMVQALEIGWRMPSARCEPKQEAAMSPKMCMNTEVSKNIQNNKRRNTGNGHKDRNAVVGLGWKK